MGTEKERDGFDRRQFLRRAAVAGAAAAWAAPVVKTIVGTPAFATDVTGSPKDLSFIVVFYSCNSGPECAVKWNIGGLPENGSFNMPDCPPGSSTFVNAGCGDDTLFDVSGSGSSMTVCLKEDAFTTAGCRITRGVAKAGSSQSTSNPCVTFGPSEDGRCITFGGVGTEPSNGGGGPNH